MRAKTKQYTQAAVLTIVCISAVAYESNPSIFVGTGERYGSQRFIEAPIPNASSQPMALPTDHFPSDWKTTEEALAALRKIEAQSAHRNWHAATHVLYDLRSFLGARPATYLEIGSYTGVSASLLLSHHFPTSVTAVDPCVLPKDHFNGDQSQENTIRNRLESQAPHDCHFRKPWKLLVGFSPEALPRDETFDIIFIDGDHSRQAVFNDYHHTINLLRPGGFLVFDDYLDWQYSPEVKGAVDEIAAETKLIDVGVLRDVHNIHPDLKKRNEYGINEYIFQKPGKFEYTPEPQSDLDSLPVLCVTVATYRRADGSTPLKLERLWKMLHQQSYKNWRLYLTGDVYVNQSEWDSLSFLSDNRVAAHNLPDQEMRFEGVSQWYNGGLFAMNDAINRLLQDGHEWNVHLDDDDVWDSDHLENIAAGIRTGATFVMTSAQYLSGFLPSESTNYVFTQISHGVNPRPCEVPHSAVAFNAKLLTARYEMTDMAADANLWSRIVYEDAFFPAYVPVESAHHLSEQGKASNHFIARKFVLENIPVPPGWHGNHHLGEKVSEYSALAIDEFPHEISRYCRHVIGPTSAPPKWIKLSTWDIPYHIKLVSSFHNFPVWAKK